MKHTPGPWRNIENNVLGIRKGTEESICVAWTVQGNPNESTANARLIAKAPELAKALKDLISWVDTTAMHNMNYDNDLLPVGLEKWKELVADL